MTAVARAPGSEHRGNASRPAPRVVTVPQPDRVAPPAPPDDLLRWLARQLARGVERVELHHRLLDDRTRLIEDYRPDSDCRGVAAAVWSRAHEHNRAVSSAVAFSVVLVRAQGGGEFAFNVTPSAPLASEDAGAAPGVETVKTARYLSSQWNLLHITMLETLQELRLAERARVEGDAKLRSEERAVLFKLVDESRAQSERMLTQNGRLLETIERLSGARP